MKHLSLIQRLWLLVLMLFVLASCGALLANLLNARNYLEQQLTLQNTNTANALALLISQNGADPAMAETLVNATFDQGHYRAIRWHDAVGQLKLGRTSQSEDAAPAWITHVLTLNPVPGRANVNAGWMQAGALTVESNPAFAYVSLQKSLWQTMLWLLLVGLMTGLLGSLDLNRLRRELGRVVAQTQAISERRFVQIPEPSIPELASVVRAMNSMVGHLQKYLDGLTREVDQLRRDSLSDAVTGLANREALAQTYQSLQDQEGGISGHLLLLRVDNLAELNQSLGGARTDVLLKEISAVLTTAVDTYQNGLAVRLRGADFALLVPELAAPAARELAQKLCDQIALFQSMGLTDRSGVIHVGMVSFEPSNKLGELLARANQALTQAALQSENSWFLDASCMTLSASTDRDWRALIETACREQQLELTWYPIVGGAGQALWHEGMLFRPATPDEPVIRAFSLLSQSLRLGLTHLLDLAALDLALAHSPVGKVAINFSPASLSSAEFLPQVLSRLTRVENRQLTFEFHETGLKEHWPAFIAFCQSVAEQGHQCAVEIIGQNLELVSRLNSSGIAYLVVDGSLTMGIHQDSGRQTLLKGLLRMTTLMSVQLIAKGIAHAEDGEALLKLGVDGLTGPAIGQASPAA